MIDCRLQRTSESLTVKGQSFPDDWLSSRWWLVERDSTNKPALLPHPPQRSRAAGADFTRLYVRSVQELGTKDVAHSRYRGHHLRGGTQRLHRPHLQPVTLTERFGVALLFLQHPVQVRTECPRRGDGRLRLPFARSNF